MSTLICSHTRSCTLCNWVSDDLALSAATIWLCASCQTCTTRCPQGIDLARVMDALRQIALARGRKPAVPAVATFQSVFLRDIRLLGRSYEPGLIVEMNMRMGSPLKDAGMGLRMATRGKIRLLPSVTRPPKGPRRMAQADEIGYYPGCSLHSLSSELDVSTRAVASELDLALVEPDGWTCCGSSAAHGSDHVLATALPLRNLALMEESGFTEVVAPCSACYFRFKSAQRDLREDAALQSAVAEQIGSAGGRVRVLSLLDLLGRADVQRRLVERVSRPLRTLRIASYYGCLLTRPPSVTGALHPENPQQMDDIVAALGAEAIDWSYKTDCCGGSLSLTRTSVALALTRRLLLAARDLGVDAVVTSCPMCHVNLDARQAQLGLDFQLPVLYITQLIGLSLGLPARRLGLSKHMVSPQKVLDRLV